MVGQPSAASAASAASVSRARSSAPVHSRRRRDARSVCAGHFDEIPTPRGGMPKYTVLSGVSNIELPLKRRFEQEHRAHDSLHGAYPLATDVAAVTARGSRTHGRSARERDIVVDLEPYGNFPSLITRDDDDDSLDDYSGVDDDEYLGPLSALPPTPGRSIASSETSRTSSRRPITPFDPDVLSPTTTVSPTLSSAPYPATASHRRYTVGDSKFSSAARKQQGKVRPRADSMNSEPDLPLSKRAKIDRGQMPKAAAPAQASALGESSAPRPRGRKSASRKGWKGWVEVEEDTPLPPTLIKLDAPAPILPERRTRSGKNFDGIGVGDGTWVP